MLLCRQVSHGVEHVSVVERTLGHGPIFHCSGHSIRNGGVQLLTRNNSLFDGLKDSLWKTSLHLWEIKDIFCPDFF